MIYALLAILSGISATVQGGVNAALRISLDSPILAALVSFTVGTLALVMMAVTQGTPAPGWSQIQTVSWWHWTGGLLGAFFVYSMIIAVPQLGAGNVFSLIIAGQILSAVLLDHFGLLGFPIHELSLLRFVGVILLIGGAWLIQKY